MFSGQRYNHSVLFRENGDVRKVLEPEARFTREQAESLSEQVALYADRLSVVGVPTPARHTVSVKIADGHYRVEEVATNMGENCEVLLRSGSQAEAIVDMIMGSLAEAMEDSDLGIDPHPANWCVGSDFSYIDFHPARLLYKGRHLVGYPQPVSESDRAMSYSRYYLPLGILRILRFNLIRACGPQIEGSMLAIMGRRFPCDLTKSLLVQLEALPEKQVGRRSLSELLEPLDITQIDDVREIAMRLANGNSGDFLTRVLKLTTADFRLPTEVRRKRFAKAKRLLTVVTSK